jgi:hypothetical protein
VQAPPEGERLRQVRLPVFSDLIAGRAYGTSANGIPGASRQRISLLNVSISARQSNPSTGRNGTADPIAESPLTGLLPGTTSTSLAELAPERGGRQGNKSVAEATAGCAHILHSIRGGRRSTKKNFVGMTLAVVMEQSLVLVVPCGDSSSGGSEPGYLKTSDQIKTKSS